MRRLFLLPALTALLLPSALAAALVARALRLPEFDVTIDPFDVEFDLLHRA